MGSVRHTPQTRSKWDTRKIYVLWAVGTTLFKVGIAASPKRIRDIQGNSPLELAVIGTKPATIRQEFEMHQKLKEFRHRGEWFSLPEPQVWALAKWIGCTIPDGIQVASL